MEATVCGGCASSYTDVRKSWLSVWIEKRLNRLFNSNRADRTDLKSSQLLLWIGRALLILSAISLSTMPLTQHLWSWDRFLHGGQDFELGALAVLVVLSLALVLCRQRRQSLDMVLAKWRLLPSNAMQRKVVGDWMKSAIAAFPNQPAPPFLCPGHSMPIRI